MGMHETTYISPLGSIRLVADEGALRELTFGEAGGASDSPILAAAGAQLDEYFAGTRTVFDLPLQLDGTAWEQRVWEALLAIPYGTTESYGRLAERIGAPGSARAVGAANGRNPVSIVVPCHRVVGSDGSLTGYAGGLSRKKRLLALEGA